MEAVHHLLGSLAELIDLVGICIVLYGFILALFGLFRAELERFRHGFCPTQLLSVRVQLGGYILAGIEFMIASDIINTVLSRELMDLAFVFSLVVIRTAISFFLGREVNELAEVSAQDSRSHA